MSFIEELNKLNKQSWLLIQGIFILLTLISILFYTYQDYQKQSEIKEKCGWNPSDTVSCVCTKTAWTQYESSLDINFTKEDGTTKLLIP